MAAPVPGPVIGYVLIGVVLIALLLLYVPPGHPPYTNHDGPTDGHAVPVKTPEPPCDEVPIYTEKGVPKEAYTVLVGDFSSPDLADECVQHLHKHRVNGFIQQVDGSWHVTVGTYASVGRAESTRRVLLQKGFRDAVVVGPGIK